MIPNVEHKSFQGVRTEVASSVGFDEVLTRLRALMGCVNPSEIVALAQSAIPEAEFVRKTGSGSFIPTSALGRKQPLSHPR